MKKRGVIAVLALVTATAQAQADGASDEPPPSAPPSPSEPTGEATSTGRIYGSSQTFFRWYEVLDPNDPGGKVFQTPIYEYITLGSDDVGVEGFSVHLRGFGRVHVVDPVAGEGDKFQGDVLVGTLTYRCPKGRVFARIGRQFLFGGAGNATLLDGAFVEMRPGLDLAVSGYAGYVPFPAFEYDPGRWAFGGRLAYDPWDFGRLGVSFGGERGEGQWARAHLGADWAFRYLRWLDVSGSLLVDLLDRGSTWLEARSIASVLLDRDWRFSFDYGMFNPTGRLPKTSIFTVFTDTRYHVVGGEVGFFGEGMLEARAYGRYYRYSGDSAGYEAGLRPVLRLGAERQHLAGVEVSRLRGPWNAYTAVRVFGLYRPVRRLDLTVDFAEYLYDHDVWGRARSGARTRYDRSHVAVLTAGYEVLEGARVQADLSVTVNPEFEQQWVGLLKFTYDFSTWTRPAGASDGWAGAGPGRIAGGTF